MKKITKRIMALMLSLVMILGCIPSFINEASAVNISTVADVLATVEFPTTIDGSTPVGEWKNDKDCLAILSKNEPPTLYFFDSYYGPLNGLSYYESLSAIDANTYEYSGGDKYIKCTFNMTGDILTSITVSDTNSNIDGTFVPTKTISTIADVLATADGGFPTTADIAIIPDNAWVGSEGKKLFIYNDNLYAYIPSDGEIKNIVNTKTFNVTSGDDEYTASNGAFTFKMEDGKLTSIIYNKDTSLAKGVYMPATLTIAEIIKTVPVGFPTTLENAWKSNDGTCSAYYIPDANSFYLNKDGDIIPIEDTTSLTCTNSTGNKYVNDDKKIQFVMGNGILESVIDTSSTPSKQCLPTKIEKVDLVSSGILATNIQTLKFEAKEGDDAPYTLNYTADWYDGDPSLPYNFSSVGYAVKKLVITPKSGYKFDENTKVDYYNTPIVTGNGNINDDGALVVLVTTTVEADTISLDFKKPETMPEINNLITNSPNGITIAGGCNIDRLLLDDLVNLYKDEKYLGYILLRTRLKFADQSARDSIENVIYSGNKLSMTDDFIEDTAINDDSLKAHFVNHEYGLANFSADSIEVIEKLFLGSSYEFSIDVAAGKTVQDVIDSFQKPNDLTLDKIIVFDIENFTQFSATDVLENNKTYGVQIRLSGGNAGSCTSVKVNGVSIPYKEVGEPVTCFEPYGYDNTMLIVNIVSLKSSSGSRKKKKTETKPAQPVEPQKTLEEKLQEELKKDDVKKANSDEKENINPQAKYINGYDDGTFKANNNVSNIELMSMVTQLFDNVEIKETKDLNQGENYWGQEIIDKANALGLVPGDKDDKNYNLMGDVTRGDLAVVVYNLIKDFSNAPSLKDRDNCKDAIGKSYEKEAAKLLELGIFKGYDDGMFHGDYTLTRAEAVVVINRALKSLGFEINMPKISLSFPDLDPSHWAYAEIMYAANK